MTKQKVGLILFWIAVIWAILWGVVGSFFVGPTYRNSTLDEVNQTMWAMGGTWHYLWGLGVPLAAVAACVGILLHSGAKGSTVWKCGIGVLLGIIAAMAAVYLGYIPLLFGIGGTLILLFFIKILWLWAKERAALEGASTAAADLKLVGYVFMLVAAWFICGMASLPFMKALESLPLSSPMHVLVFLVLGWFFLFLGHYKSRAQ